MKRETSFVAVDFETANGARSSICAVGWARVTGGSVASFGKQLINPGVRFTNTYIHGISERDVTDQPTWTSYFDSFQQVVGLGPLVAYSSFDKSAYTRATEGTQYEDVEFSWYDALPVARRILPELSSHRLPIVARSLGVSEFDHHDPQADALALAHVVLALIDKQQPEVWTGLWTNKPKPTRSRGSWSLPDTNFSASAEHPLYGRQICFSGALENMTRSQAWAVAASRGAIIKQGVVLSLDFLVIGNNVHTDPLLATSKVRKALDYQSRGAPIRVLHEDDFIELVSI